MVIDAEDSLELARFVGGLHDLESGRLVCHPLPGGTSERWLAFDLLSALGKDLTGSAPSRSVHARGGGRSSGCALSRCATCLCCAATFSIHEHLSAYLKCNAPAGSSSGSLVHALWDPRSRTCLTARRLLKRASAGCGTGLGTVEVHPVPGEPC